MVKAQAGQGREIGSLRTGRPRPHIGSMQHLDRTEDEAAALIKELRDSEKSS